VSSRKESSTTAARKSASYVAYAAPWEDVPDDGLERFDEARAAVTPAFVYGGHPVVNAARPAVRTRRAAFTLHINVNAARRVRSRARAALTG
jgi:hypothetical protein